MPLALLTLFVGDVIDNFTQWLHPELNKITANVISLALAKMSHYGSWAINFAFAGKILVLTVDAR